MLVDIGVPVLRDWIIQSRDEALARGVKGIPEDVRFQLSCYVPEDILNAVRWRIGGDGELTLQTGAFYLGRTPAITLDYVIVFRREADGLHNVELWLHELKHVMQYKAWGIEGFAARYLQNYAEIESDASRYRWDWVLGPARQKGPC